MANKRDKNQQQQPGQQQQSDMDRGIYDKGDKGASPQHETDAGKRAGEELDRDNERKLDQDRE